MTPIAFAQTYQSLAMRASALTGVRADVILAQWAVETGWGSSALAVNWHNLAGIRWYGRIAQVQQVGGTPGKPGTGFAGYRSPDTFLTDYVHVMRLPYYTDVRSAGTSIMQARALGESPWDAGHYISGGVKGGSLLAALSTVKAAMVPSGALPAESPAPAAARTYVVKPGDSLWRIALAAYGRGSLFGRIAVANGIASPWTIRVGQRLIIP